MAVLPTLQNDVEIENHLLQLMRDRAVAARFEFISMLIEARLHETGPEWLRNATMLDRIDNYLGSGIPFAYLQVALGPAVAPEPTPMALEPEPR